LALGSWLAVIAAVVAGRREPVHPPADENRSDALTGPSSTLKARVVSWDVGFHPSTEDEWVERVVAEVRAASADGVDVLLFPELFAAGLAPYAANERAYEFITRRMRDRVLPAVSAAAGPAMLVCLGSYAHQEPGWPDAINRAPMLLGGVWHFIDKLHPTQGELVDDPPIRAGEMLPVFRFRGGNVAVVVCFSLEMPEVAAALKKENVLLVLGPTATSDEDGVARVLRSASARAVELGAAVLVAPLVGRQGDWPNVGSTALYLPAQKGIDHQPRVSVLRSSGIAHDDYTVPWSALLDLRRQPTGRPETRPFLAEHPFRIERK
jgi:predicted amidohydrolase